MRDDTANVIFDEQGRGIVIINDIRFMGRQSIDWEDVECYLRDYINKNYKVLESADVIFIGSDMPSEIKGSNDTRRLKGTHAKAKANAVTELPVYDSYGELLRYNVFRIEMLVRHASDDKLYLYDLVNVKKEKETGTPPRQ